MKMKTIAVSGGMVDAQHVVDLIVESGNTPTYSEIGFKSPSETNVELDANAGSIPASRQK